MNVFKNVLVMIALLASYGCGDNLDEMLSYGGTVTTGGGGGGGTVVTVTVTPATVPDGTVGAAYSQTFSATGGTAPYTWSIVGTPPAGITINSSTGVLGGTPTAAGTYSFTVRAMDSSLATGSQAITLAVYSVPTISTTSIAAAQQGVSYSAILSATGGQTPYVWSSVSGFSPPLTGITLNANGTITGTTTDAAGDYLIEVIVTDAASRASASQWLTLTVNAGIMLSPTTLPAGTAGAAYNQTLTASGGSSPYTCTLTNGTLPAGLNLTTASATTCLIDGTPTTAGTFNFQVTATDTWSFAGAQNYSITINLGMSATTLPNASVLAGPYSFDLNTYLAGETGATTWTLTGGSLPTNGGWALSPAGFVTGTPDALDEPGGAFSFTVDVADSATTPNTASFTLSLDVVP